MGDLRPSLTPFYDDLSAATFPRMKRNESPYDGQDTDIDHAYETNWRCGGRYRADHSLGSLLSMTSLTFLKAGPCTVPQQASQHFYGRFDLIRAMLTEARYGSSGRFVFQILPCVLHVRRQIPL